MVYFMTWKASQNLQHYTTGESWIGKHLEGSVHGLMATVSWQLPEESEKDHEYLRIDYNISADIRAWLFLNL